MSGVSEVSGSPGVYSLSSVLSETGVSGSSPTTNPDSPSKSAGTRGYTGLRGQRPAESMTVLTKVISVNPEICTAWNGVKAWEAVVMEEEGRSVVG